MTPRPSLFTKPADVESLGNVLARGMPQVTERAAAWPKPGVVAARSISASTRVVLTLDHLCRRPG